MIQVVVEHHLATYKKCEWQKYEWFSRGSIPRVLLKINYMKNFEEQLDYYAVEYYGEFGYDTLSSEEKKEVRKIVIEKLYE